MTVKSKPSRATAKLQEEYEKQQERFRATYQKIVAESRKLEGRQRKILANAENGLIAARKNCEVDRFEQIGIEIDKTVVLYHPRYTSELSMNRYVVVLTRNGYARLQPVTKAGKRMNHRNAEFIPINLEKIIRTDFEATP